MINIIGSPQLSPVHAGLICALEQENFSDLRLCLLECDTKTLESAIKHYPHIDIKFHLEQAIIAQYQASSGVNIDLVKSYQELFTNPHPFFLTIDPEITKQFIENGASGNEQDEKGYAALHYLAQNRGDVKCLEVLLCFSADLFLRANNHLTPLDIASELNNTWFLQCVLKSDAAKYVPRPPLHMAILLDAFAMIEQLAPVSDPAITDIFGETALMTAIRYRSFQAIPLLSSWISQADLLFAVEQEDSEMLSCLIKHRFPTGEVDKETMTELLSQAIEDSSEVADWIVEHYAHLCSDHYDLCMHLLSSGLCSKYIDLFQERVGEIKKRRHIGNLFLEALRCKQMQQASFLLGFIEDITFFDDPRGFYHELFRDADTEMVEKVIKKITITDDFFGNNQPAHALYQHHPHLFTKISCKLFEQGFLFCQQSISKDEIYCFKAFRLKSILTLAIFSGRLDLIERCYNQFGTSDEIKTQLNTNNSLLEIAIESGHPELVSYFFEKQLEIKWPFINELTLAKELGNVTVIQTLTQALEQHHIAVEGVPRVQPPSLVTLARPRPRLVEVRDLMGKTELFRAVVEGNFSEVKRLLDLGADPNSQDITGEQILAAATRLFTQGYYMMTGKAFALIALLVERGASCTRMIGQEYLNIFDWAFFHRNYGVLFALHRQYKQHIPIQTSTLQSFYKACEIQDLEFVLKYYPNIELQSLDEYNTSICHTFIERNRLDLLEKYAAASPQNFKKHLEFRQEVPWSSKSLLYSALMHGKSEIAAFLRAKGASFHRDPTLLIISPELTKQFLDEGMNVNEQTPKGYSALHYLGNGNGNDDCLPILLSRKVDFFLPNSEGQTPLSIMEEEPGFRRDILKAAVSSNIPRESLPDTVFADAIETAIFYEDFSALKEQASHISEDYLFVAISRGSENMALFLIEQYRATKEENEETIRKIFFDALEYHNRPILRWCIENYALRYLSLFGEDLLEGACAGVSLHVLQECMQEMKKSQEHHNTLGSLFIKALEKKQPHLASFLLELIDDLSYFKNVAHLYKQLFEHGEREFCEKVIKKYTIPDACFADKKILVSLSAHQPEVFTRFIPLVCKRITSFESGFVLALELGNIPFIQIMGNSLIKQKTVDFTTIYTELFCLAKSSQISEARLKQCLLWTLKVQRKEFSRHEDEEIASQLMQIAELSSEPQEFSLLVTQSLAALLLKAVVCLTQRLPSECKIPCGHLSISQTISWIIKEVFIHCYRMNPELFCKPRVFDFIGDLVGQVRKNEDYGALFVALQTAPDIETAQMAFQRAQALESGSLIKPAKALFVSSSLEEQKRWITYALVYRDRSFIPLLYYLIKQHSTHPELLRLALLAIQRIGVRRLDSELKNSLEDALKNLLQISNDEKIKIEALKAYVEVSVLSQIDFLLELLQEARKRLFVDYEAVLSRLLGTHYEWTSDVECDKAVEHLVIGLKSPHEEVRFQTAVALSAIPHEQGLFAALDAVLGPTWDRMLEHFGKDRRNHTGSCLAFIHRPSELHDNRHAMINRIILQLVRVHEKKSLFFSFLEEHPSSEGDVQNMELQFKQIDLSSTRYVHLPIAYPPKRDLLRGLSTRKGRRGFRESVRDLLRKGAGSSQLTDYDALVYNNTWSKIGHIFASHDKDLFFGSEQGSFCFSADTSGTITEGALIVFPASYYQKEYLLGEARHERENTFNAVLYRGIPHRWIKAVYLPERFKHDIERLAANETLEEVKKGLTSDLFCDDTLEELKAFRKLLTSVEPDLTQEPAKPRSFYEKIRYFPPQDAKKVGERLLQDGISFASVEEIKKETLLLRRKALFLVNHHYKDRFRFWAQDMMLKRATDAEFKANQDRFFNMLPKALFLTEEAKEKAKRALAMLKTDGFEQFRAPIRIACLLNCFEETEVMALLKQNPSFYGLVFSDIAFVCALIKGTKENRELLEQSLAILTLIKRRDISFELFWQMVLAVLCTA